MKKIGIIFGGPSNEHEVSISSAINVAKNIDKDKFETALIYWNVYFFSLTIIVALGLAQRFLFFLGNK